MSKDIESESSISLLILSSAAFLSVYIFEMGFASVFQYPKWLIDIDINSLISFPFRLPHITWVILLLVEMFLFGLSDKLSELGLYFLHKLPFIATLILLSLLPSIPIYERLIPAAALLLLYIFPKIVVPALSKKYGPTIRERIVNSHKEDMTSSSVLSSIVNKYRSVSGVVLLSFVVFIYAYQAGRSSALSTHMFNVIEVNEVEYVLIRQYSDHLVCVEYDAFLSGANLEYYSLPYDRKISMHQEQIYIDI